MMMKRNPHPAFSTFSHVNVGEGRALPSPGVSRERVCGARVRGSIALLLMLLGTQVWAGSDMSSTNYKIRRSNVNSGGSNRGSSANYKLTNTVGAGGGSLFQRTT